MRFVVLELRKDKEGNPERENPIFCSVGRKHKSKDFPSMEGEYFQPPVDMSAKEVEMYEESIKENGLSDWDMFADYEYRYTYTAIDSEDWCLIYCIVVERVEKNIKLQRMRGYE